MPKWFLPIATGGLVLAACLFACRGKGAHSAENRPAPVAVPPRSETATPEPALDETGPALDLLASRALWHLYRAGLVIPFASEGFRKYSQEYTNPWRGIAKLEDRAGRALGTTSATLRFPWDGEAGAATVVARLHGGSAGKKLAVRLNGRPVGNAQLESGW